MRFAGAKFKLVFACRPARLSRRTCTSTPTGVTETPARNGHKAPQRCLLLNSPMVDQPTTVTCVFPRLGLSSGNEPLRIISTT